MRDLDHQLDLLDAGDATRRALLSLVASGMPATAIEQLAQQRSRGLAIYLATEPGQPTPVSVRPLEVPA